MRRSFFLLCMVWAFTAMASAPSTGDPFVRTVRVPGAGWYTFPMDHHLWAHAHGRVDAYGPDGKPLSCGVVPRHVPSPFEESAQPELVDYAQDAAQAVMTLKIPNPAGPHTRLEFAFSRPDYLEWVTLEGSDSGRDWKFLARGKLFMLSGEQRLQQAALEYPPTPFSYLRLTLPIPRGEGMPQISDLRVFYQPGKEATAWEATRIPLKPVEEPLASILAETGMHAYRLDLPPGHYMSTRIDHPLLVPHPPIRVVLWSLAAGVPQKLYSCTLWPGAKILTFPRAILEAPLILAVDGPPLNEVYIHERRDEVLFYASSSGPVTLAYGGIEKREQPPFVPPAGGAAPASPTPPQTRPLALSPQLLPLAAIKPPSNRPPDQTWSLNFPSGIMPGQWVQIVLPDELISAGRENLRGFGIYAGGAQIPSFIQELPEPRLVIKEVLHFKPAPAFPNQSEAELGWSGAYRPISFLALASPQKPLRCTLTLSQKNPVPEKHPLGTRETPAWTAVDRRDWMCGPWDSACDILIPLQVSGIDRLKIILDGAEPSGPDTLETSLWERRYRLVFPFPSSGMGILTWSANRFPSAGRLAEYVRPELLPERLPEAVVGAGTSARTPDKRWETVLFYGALVLAAAVLIFLIVRLLPRAGN